MSALAEGERLFPVLTPEQIARIRLRGRLRQVRSGDVLIEVGSRVQGFFVVITGELETIHPTEAASTLVGVIRPGQFTGEVSVLAERPALFRTRVRVAGEVIEVDQGGLRNLVQVDPELGELLVRIFLLRRLGLIAAGVGSVVVIGSAHSAGTLRVREFLSRNGQPYQYIDLDRYQEAHDVFAPAQFGASDIPVVLCNGKVLRDPTNEEVAACIGLADVAAPARTRDLVVIGAGPAGLAAAVYGASEGLDVLVVDAGSLGGQAGSSSRIENYLGFPNGISGQDLAYRAYTQAEKFGAHLAVGMVERLRADEQPYVVELHGGARVSSHAVVIATGVQYRKPDVSDLSRFEGAGVYYAATAVEGELCRGGEVVVVGGANSAGQAAVFLSKAAGRVRMFVRSNSLSSAMSHYLIRRIEEVAAIEVHLQTEIVAMLGEEHLEVVRYRNNDTGEIAELPVQHVFLMTGGAPNTAWLGDGVALDQRGFIRTGPDLGTEDLAARNWPLARQPYSLETSLPGVFAVGDVRGGNVKRVAAAVGEGSTAISYVSRFLHDER